MSEAFTDVLMQTSQRAKDRFDKAAQLTTDSTKFNLGNVARTINIPTLAMMFLHPRVNERFGRDRFDQHAPAK